MERSCNCPQCGRPDLVVVERPNIVKCLVCGCAYQYEEVPRKSVPIDVSWQAWRPLRLRPPSPRPMRFSSGRAGMRKMKITGAEMRLLRRIKQAGGRGVLWTRFSSTVARNLHRKGLIEFRMESLCENNAGARTGMRFVAVDVRKPRRGIEPIDAPCALGGHRHQRKHTKSAVRTAVRTDEHPWRGSLVVVARTACDGGMRDADYELSLPAPTPRSTRAASQQQ